MLHICDSSEFVMLRKPFYGSKAICCSDTRCSAAGTTNEKQPASNPEIGSTSQEGRKRKRFATEEDEETISLHNQLVDILERNGKMLASQLEAQNANFQLDREQRKDDVNSLIGVLGKLADALARIADKL